MNVVENDVRILVDKELAAANERFPQFHSQHEGYAVVLEEMDELKIDVYNADQYLSYVWDSIKDNSSGRTRKNVMIIKGIAIDAACEAIQVAAMCKKFLDMEGKR